jgi:putative addiction module component (TIGR02574 family)
MRARLQSANMLATTGKFQPLWPRKRNFPAGRCSPLSTFDSSRDDATIPRVVSDTDEIHSKAFSHACPESNSGLRSLMLKEAIPQFAELSSSEKLLLLEELWDDLADHPSEVPVPDWQKRELERRYQEFLQNPTEGSSWSEVRERLLRTFQ